MGFPARATCQIGKILDRLSDHFQLPKRGILTHAFDDERIMIGSAVRADVVEGFSNV